ncbi:aspartyl/glutamyl-tRNA amidotransferase subunit C [Candidatus Parcubacteria bacterium]|nr:aspartyl/glutamyl-tRNA amidotransferase subunit C [Candidatus Parcubacteria bacterium]
MSSKKITPSQFKHIAKLAKLKLTKEDENKYLSQLSSILDYFRRHESILAFCFGISDGIATS